MIVVLTQLGAIAWRSTLHTVLQPASAMPTLVVPALFLAIVTAGLQDVSALPGFPADSYLDFALAGTFVHGAMVLGIGCGSELARDLESGFLDRLFLSPARGGVVLIGQLGGALAVAVLQSALYLGLGLALGVRVEAGVAGAAAIVALALLAALAFSGVGVLLALRTRSAEAVQGLFPLFFVTLSFSSFFLPRDLIEAGWFEAIATWNPVTYLIEAIRSLVLGGWDGWALATGFGVGAAVAAVSIGAASMQLRGRLKAR